MQIYEATERMKLTRNTFENFANEDDLIKRSDENVAN